MIQQALDLTVARAARDKGIARSTAANADWMADMLRHLRAFATVRETFTLEQFRVECGVFKRETPTSHHAWGALSHAMVREGIAEWTERYVSAASKKTHAHPVKLWRSLLFRRAA